MWLSLRTTLYHGTASEIQQVDVKLGRERKDFGKGFYMAVSKSQAIGMMHKNIERLSEGVRENRTVHMQKNYMKSRWIKTICQSLI